jgi:DNA-binding NarL/FixJ family response regulator
VTGDPAARDALFRAILGAILKRFIWMTGAPAVLDVARRIPRLVADEAGNVVAYDQDDPLGTITLLIDEYRTLFGDVATTLAREAAHPIMETTSDILLQEVGWLATPMTTPIEVLLVDDHVLFREGLASLLRPQPDIKVVGQAGSVNEAIALAQNLKPHIVLMDISLPDGTGHEATRAILAKQPGVKIVFLTFHDDDDELFAAIRAGAVGYLLKNVRPAELLKRLRGVAQGEAGITPVIARRILNELSRTPRRPTADQSETMVLTAREMEIVRELAGGATNREIARKLVVSESTVKNHVHSVLSKLQLHSRRDIADYARDHGLFPPPPDSPA